MKKFERFTLRHPISFGFIIIVLYSLLSTVTWPITQISTYPQGYEVGTAIAKLVIAASFLLILWGFGWLRTAGFSSSGPKGIWILVILLVVYNSVLDVYAFTGSFRISLPPAGLTLPIIFYGFTTSLVEETMYRGLLLTAMVKAWGNTRRGLFAAAVFSGLFFASTHFVNLLVRPFPVVALQVIGMTMVGFVYAAVALKGGSIWPLVIFHWMINASIGLQVIQLPNFEETTTAWVIFVLVMLPVVGVGIYLMRNLKVSLGSNKEEFYYEETLEAVNV